MSFDDSFSKRVVIARNALGLTQSDLAKKVGVVPRQIAAYEGGEAKPRVKALENLAAALGTTTDWLSRGMGNGPDISNIKRTVTLREIPVYMHAHASVAEGVPLFSGMSPFDFIPAPACAGERSFALHVEGHSMTASSGVSFPEGYLVCFDPDLSAEPGDFVLCSYGNFTMFKQLIRDQGRFFLRSLNPDYPLIGVDESLFIIGVAINSQLDLIKFKRSCWNDDNNPWEEVLKWDPKTTVNEEPSIYLRLESIERKLNALLADKGNNKPT